MLTILELHTLQDEYRKLIDRYKKAMSYLSNKSIPEKDREALLPEFERITQRLNELVGILGLTKEKIKADI